MPSLSVALVTPALAAANNGNWQTARRWSRFLAADFRVDCVDRWSGGDQDLMVALHARRSAASIAAWREQHPGRPLVVVLTGTDLYRDIAVDASAQRSLALADRLVVLNECGADALPTGLRPKVRVILQSSPPRATRPKPARSLRALMVGHLREEKSPRTYFDAARALAHRSDIALDHVGNGLDAELAAEAAALAADAPTYRWLGGLPHGTTVQRIARAHVLVHASLMEGGAHVVIEAVTGGTPVLASRIAGNVGLLGADYAGYFEPGDASGLAALLERSRDDPTMLDRLQSQCARRAPLFDPARERAGLLALLNDLSCDPTPGLLPRTGPGDTR